MIHALTAWRYWLLPQRRGTPIRLHPFGPQDKTHWQAGTTVARCRHDPTHTPPHPDCTCGLFAMTLIDVRYSVGCRNWVQNRVRNAIERQHARDQISGYNQTTVPDPDDWVSAQPKPVIGKVQLHHAVETTQTEDIADGEYVSRCWRARAATIEALYVPEEAAHAARVLSAVYEVPCEVGYPDSYSMTEWNQRTRLDTHLFDPGQRIKYPEFAELGLYPPGTDDAAKRADAAKRSPPPRRFLTATVPARRTVQTWTERT